MPLENDMARRHPHNPLLSPKDLQPSQEGLEITSLLNPGAFRFDNKSWLIVRVAERPVQQKGIISFPYFDANGAMQIMEIEESDADLNNTDARVIQYKGADYLTTLSHLRLLSSSDGRHFAEEKGYPRLYGQGSLEAFGIEDCRVSQIGDTYYLTFTAVSENGVGVGMKTTRDWKNFESHGMIIPPHNKDCAIFEEKINGKFYALHRPSSVEIGGNYIWMATSPDGLHWGNYQCLIRTRKGMWDSKRVGAGAAPVKTKKGWLEIYHGANEKHQYCLGGLLLDLENPSRVLARSEAPIMMPQEVYELEGFFGNVVFTNGHIPDEDGDTLTVFYGASDEHVCSAKFSVEQILSQLTYLK